MQKVRETFLSLGKRMPGVLYEPEDIAGPLPTILIMHSDEDYLTFPTGREMAGRGYRVLCANVMNKEGMFFSLAEKLDAVALAVKKLRADQRSEKIYLLGHSGGATLMTAYQAVAENGPEIFQADSYIYPYDGTGSLPPADGIILADANWGNAVMQLFSLDPAVTDEESGMKLDPAYNLFEEENGFSKEGSHFSRDFVQRFLRQQGKRNNRILEEALDRWQKIRKGQGRYRDDEPLTIPGANQGFFNNKLYAQDVRLMSHTARPRRLLHPDGSVTTETVRSLRRPENPVSLTASLREGGRIMTVRNYLSSYAVRTTEDYGYDEDSVTGIDWHSTYNSPIGNVVFIRSPMLVMGMTGGWEYLAAETIFEHAAGEKELIFVEGATHVFTPLRAAMGEESPYGDTMKTVHDEIARWIESRKQEGKT